MKKILIISYYWPPSGGAGVQRWLKLSHYLKELGHEVFVICPQADKASYLTVDKSLDAEVDSRIKVIRTSSFEPLNLYKSLVGIKNVPTAGMSNVNTNRWTQRLALWLRSNLFIPDPRKYWKKYAVKAAIDLIDKEGIEHIITSSPPHSVQNIGLSLQRKRKIKWIADLRDLWTGIYYYDLLMHSSWSRSRDERMEKRVLKKADHLIAVSPIFLEEFKSKVPEVAQKSSVIPNGYDPKDFKSFDHSKEVDFVITYTGTISAQYNTAPFIHALRNFRNLHPKAAFTLRFVGQTAPQIRAELEKEGLIDHVEFIPYVEHAKAIAYLEESYALLLVGPLNEASMEGSIPAKIFEYLAAKRHIIYIGKQDGFVAQLIRETKAGEVFDQDHTLITRHLEELYLKHKAKPNPEIASVNIEKYSRQLQAKSFHELVENL